MSLREYCENCGTSLAYKGQICPQCGVHPKPEKGANPAHYKHRFFFIPYLLVEVFCLLICLASADLKGGGDGAIFSYVFLRIVFAILTYKVFAYGRKVKSSALKNQGGCFLIFNLIILLTILYLLSGELF